MVLEVTFDQRGRPLGGSAELGKKKGVRGEKRGHI